MCSEMFLAEARHITERVRSKLRFVFHGVEAYLLTPRIKLKDAATSPDEGQHAGRREIKRFTEFP